MKQLTNPATPLALLLMALAMAFTISCESKEEKQAKADAEATPTEEASGHLSKAQAECEHKKIGSPKTIEAEFLASTCGDGCYANVRLSDGEVIILQHSDDNIENIKEGTKVSVTYQSEQRWIANYEVEAESGCFKTDILESVKILSEAGGGGVKTEKECPNITGPLQTSEATLLEADGGPEAATFLLADGNKIWLLASDLFVDYGDPPELKQGLKKGDKVSITYRENQIALETCTREAVLESFTKLPNK